MLQGKWRHLLDYLESKTKMFGLVHFYIVKPKRVSSNARSPGEKTATINDILGK